MAKSPSPLCVWPSSALYSSILKVSWVKSAKMANDLDALSPKMAKSESCGHFRASLEPHPHVHVRQGEGPSHLCTPSTQDRRGRFALALTQVFASRARNATPCCRSPRCRRPPTGASLPDRHMPAIRCLPHPAARQRRPSAVVRPAAAWRLPFAPHTVTRAALAHARADGACSPAGHSRRQSRWESAPGHEP